jgi:hypothetical protein
VTGQDRAAKLRALRDAWKARALRAEASRDELTAELGRLRAAFTLPGSHRWGPLVERWRSLVDYWMRQWGREKYDPAVHLDPMLGIMAYASGGDPLRVCQKVWIGTPPDGYDPDDDSTKASGLFEQGPSWWEGRSRAAGMEGRSIFDADANVAVSCWLLWDGWNPEEAPHWHHWSGAHVGQEGSYEWALRQIAEAAKHQGVTS